MSDSPLLAANTGKGASRLPVRAVPHRSHGHPAETRLWEDYFCSSATGFFAPPTMVSVAGFFAEPSSAHS